MSASIIGRFTWEGERDDDGYRTFNIAHKVRTSDPKDGPYVAMNCPGLPVIGSQWAFGNDVDAWAYCWPTLKVYMYKQNEGDNTLTWIVQQKFSTKGMTRCNSNPVNNPLMEPIKMGGTFLKDVAEATTDMFGNPLMSSSWERFIGKQVEFDYNRPTVWIEQNFATNQLGIFAPLVDCVNSSPLWGLPARCVKLDNVTWERLLFGVCSYYFRTRYEFSINYNTFDRILQDEGTKVLNGHWGSTSGTGCTLDITVSGSANGNSKNPITSATVNAAGSGYPTGSDGSGQIITLAVTGGTGTGASVACQTDSSGTVTGLATGTINGVNYGNGIINGGQAYTPGTTNGVSTSGSIWVLDKINGVTPSPNNPQHFIRYKDMNGECGRVILNGFGQPAVGVRPGTFLVQKYVGSDLTALSIPATLSG